MPWNGNVTGSTVNSEPSAHGPKEMDRLNRYHSDVDLEALVGDGSTATIRTRTMYRSGKLQFIDSNGNLITFHIPAGLTNNKDITLPNDSGTLMLGTGGSGVSSIQNEGSGVGVFKSTGGGIASLYSLSSLSSAISIALNA